MHMRVVLDSPLRPLLLSTWFLYLASATLGSENLRADLAEGRLLILLDLPRKLWHVLGQRNLHRVQEGQVDVITASI